MHLSVSLHYGVLPLTYMAVGPHVCIAQRIMFMSRAAHTLEKCLSPRLCLLAETFNIEEVFVEIVRSAIATSPYSRRDSALIPDTARCC